jgi:Zn-dependent peptidase ImmA (M78 family)/transcriptional regulator with XRE-family HTH domain
MTGIINPKMVVLAREARGMTQQELGDKVQLHKANISRLENGDTINSEEYIDSIADATGFPTQFFYLSGESLPLNLAYRKRQQVAAKLITPIEAQINIIRRHVQFLTRALAKPQLNIPAWEVDEKNTPQQIATKLRKAWNMEAGVVADLMKVMEHNGIVINQFSFGADRVDSRSILTDDKYPMIFLNSSLLGDRQRFSLAYELGHLIMHTFSIVPHDKNIGHEANVFAAELLMPAKEILKDFKAGISLPLLGELKRKWKVSMIALLYRADDLGLLTPNQKKYFIQQFNQLKIRRREPVELDIPPETPKLMRQLLASYMQSNKLGMTEMAALLAIQPDDYLDFYQ